MPTALELGHKGWKPYVEAARRRSVPHHMDHIEEMNESRYWYAFVKWPLP